MLPELPQPQRGGTSDPRGDGNKPQVEAETAFDTIQYLFTTKTPNGVGIEGMSTNLIEAINDKPAAHTCSTAKSEKLSLYRQEQDEGVQPHHFYPT